ncbi:MAG: hypothetical protein ABSB30_11480 [Terracidiphilus sp.]|jgi:hypothetical protein
MDGRAAKKNSEDPAEKASRLTARATVWMAVFTFFLALTSAGTILILANQLKEMHSGGVDTHNLADAAVKTEAAAEKSAKASRDFADSAEKINLGIGIAVDKLNLQAEELRESVRQASRLAKATEMSNANVFAADRPWIGATIKVSGFEIGKTPGADCTFTNSGRRPASIQFASCSAGFYQVLPKEPKFNNNAGMLSQGFLVPGSGITSSLTAILEDRMAPGLIQGNQPTVELLKRLDAREITFFVYGRIEYTDVRSGQAHYTHVCVQYNPPTKATAPGFYGCEAYNEGN